MDAVPIDAPPAPSCTAMQPSWSGPAICPQTLQALPVAQQGSRGEATGAFAARGMSSAGEARSPARAVIMTAARIEIEYR
jgi:hypothetical protein